MRRAAIAALALALCASCASAPEPKSPMTAKAARSAAPRAAPKVVITDDAPIAGIAPDPTPAQAGRFGAPAEADAEGRMKGIKRPRIASLDIDYEALPKLQTTETGEGPMLALHPDKVVIHGDMLGDVEIGSYSASTAGSYSTRNAPSCGTGNEGFLQARWSGIVSRSWRDDRVGVVAAEGLFDKSNCQAKPNRAGRVEAKAIVPGFMYAYRALASVDDMPRESLVIIMPYTVEVAISTGRSGELDALRATGYTRLTLPVERGSGMGFVAKMTPGSFDTWKRLKAGRSAVIETYSGTTTDQGQPFWPLLVGMEVTWQGDKRWATLQISLPEGAKKKSYAAFLQAAKADL
ncbi:MAG: hypothetical protein HOV80_35210 [Polyangiaceae bacterium]|nr:hypothetical protein [Polyangiaceae bacterium]